MINSSHKLTDQLLVSCNVSTSRVKLPPVTHRYHNIKDMNLEVFHRHLSTSPLPDDIPRTTDGYTDEIERIFTALLDDFAPQPMGRQISKVKGKLRCIWSEVKNLLHTTPPADLKTRAECESFSRTMAVFFVNKDHKIKKISTTLKGSHLDPLAFDFSHHGETLTTLAPVTVKEVMA